jgi:K+-sensing histidine kinase KdpD
LRVAELNPVVNEIVKTLHRLIGEDIELIFIPGDTVGRVRLDPVQIEQILMNLAANSRDAMPQGGRCTIETSKVQLDEQYVDRKRAVIPIGRYAVLTMTDTGTGIPASDLSHVFEPFYTTKPSGKGTGLGLATVYGIVRQNHGFVWVYSEPGMGTIFKIYLPCVPDQPGILEISDQKLRRYSAGQRPSFWLRMKTLCAERRPNFSAFVDTACCRRKTAWTLCPSLRVMDRRSTWPSPTSSCLT